MIKNIVFLFSAFYLGVSVAGPMESITSMNELEHYFSKNKFNGVILVAKDNSILMKKAFGFKNLETKEPLNVNDKFQIGSVTKQFISAALLKLQEEGKVSLNDPVSKYFPGKDEYQKITIKDLLNHTAGLMNYTEQEDFSYEYEHLYKIDDITEFIQKYPFRFEPRTKWYYSNSGYILAGKILEMITGESWDQHLTNEFLIPLKMNQTGYSEYFENISDVTGYIYENEIPYSMNKKYNMTWALSAGALYSTVDDLLKWTAIYNDSSLISIASKKEMQTPFMNGYALGLQTEKFDGDLLVSHGGRTPGFVTDVTYFTGSKLQLITLDSEDGRIANAAELLKIFFSRGQAEAVKIKTYDISAEKMQEYVGVYDSGYLKFNIYVENGKLLLFPEKQRAYELRANDVDSFNILNLFGEEFIRNNQGQLTHLNHYQNGRVTKFIKK